MGIDLKGPLFDVVGGGLRGSRPKDPSDVPDSGVKRES